MESVKHVLKYKFNFVRKPSYEEALARANKKRAELRLLGSDYSINEFQDMIKYYQETDFVPRSFSSATKDEMLELIEKIHLLTDRMDWQEIRLDSKDLEEMIKYYDNQ